MSINKIKNYITYFPYIKVLDYQRDYHNFEYATIEGFYYLYPKNENPILHFNTDHSGSKTLDSCKILLKDKRDINNNYTNVLGANFNFNPIDNIIKMLIGDKLESYEEFDLDESEKNEYLFRFSIKEKEKMYPTSLYISNNIEILYNYERIPINKEIEIRDYLYSLLFNIDDLEEIYIETISDSNSDVTVTKNNN